MHTASFPLHYGDADKAAAVRVPILGETSASAFLFPHERILIIRGL